MKKNVYQQIFDLLLMVADVNEACYLRHVRYPLPYGNLPSAFLQHVIHTG